MSAHPRDTLSIDTHVGDTVHIQLTRNPQWSVEGQRYQTHLLAGSSCGEDRLWLPRRADTIWRQASESVLAEGSLFLTSQMTTNSAPPPPPGAWSLGSAFLQLVKIKRKEKWAVDRDREKRNIHRSYDTETSVELRQLILMVDLLLVQGGCFIHIWLDLIKLIWFDLFNEDRPWPIAES